MNNTKEYCEVLHKYSSDNAITPLITILSTDTGHLAIFADNNKLTHEQKIEVLAMAYQVAKHGVAKERDQLINPNGIIDLKNFKR